MKKARFTESQIVSILKLADSSMKIDEIYRQNGISNTTSVLQVLNQVLGCCLPLSGIRNICAQIGDPHTIASTTGRPRRLI